MRNFYKKFIGILRKKNKYIEKPINPMIYAKYSHLYYEAAIGADDRIGKLPGYEFHAPMPVMFLVAHSIELSLKSYLLYVGVPQEKVRRLRHNLIRIWKLCVKNKIENHVFLEKDEVDILRIISKLHSSTELRYTTAGYKTVPVFGPLQVVTKKIRDAVCDLIGYRFSP